MAGLDVKANHTIQAKQNQHGVVIVCNLCFGHLQNSDFIRVIGEIFSLIEMFSTENISFFLLKTKLNLYVLQLSFYRQLKWDECKKMSKFEKFLIIKRGSICFTALRQISLERRMIRRMIYVKRIEKSRMDFENGCKT